MIYYQNFEINILGVLITLTLLLLLILKKLDVISILAFSSVLINVPIFNYIPWTFGFQSFFFFAIILILTSFKKILDNFKNLNFVILLTLIFLFISITFISLINSYILNIQETVIQPKNENLKPSLIVSHFSRLNITQFLYLLFYFGIFISIIVNKINTETFVKSFIWGINLNFIFQLFELLLFSFKKPLPNFLNNQSFLNETIQILYLKDFNIYRFSGLFPTSSLLGIYLVVALFLVLFYEKIFSKKQFIFQFIILIFSFLLSPSSTFILGALIVLIFYFWFLKKNLWIILFILIANLLLFYSFLRETTEIRLFLASLSLVIFKKYPLLGIGWGNHFADLFTSLLANTGILGFISFLAIFFWLIYKTFKTKSEFYLMVISIISLILMGIIWNGVNVNIVWLILGLWGREIIKNYNSQLDRLKL